MKLPTSSTIALAMYACLFTNVMATKTYLRKQSNNKRGIFVRVPKPTKPMIPIPVLPVLPNRPEIPETPVDSEPVMPDSPVDPPEEDEEEEEEDTFVIPSGTFPNLASVDISLMTGNAELSETANVTLFSVDGENIGSVSCPGYGCSVSETFVTLNTPCNNLMIRLESFENDGATVNDSFRDNVSVNVVRDQEEVLALTTSTPGEYSLNCPNN